MEYLGFYCVRFVELTAITFFACSFKNCSFVKVQILFSDRPYLLWFIVVDVFLLFVTEGKHTLLSY